jgi:hypothetical protein
MEKKSALYIIITIVLAIIVVLSLMAVLRVGPFNGS